MSYGISSRDYLCRALSLLKQNNNDVLFYAAFELRCGIQARLQQYLEAWDHIEENKKKGWELNKLGKATEKYFYSRDLYVRLSMKHPKSNNVAYSVYYTPVTRELEQSGGRLGNYLHAKQEIHNSDDIWWKNIRSDINGIAESLRIANLGTLLGPPLQEDKGQASISMEIPPTVNLDRFRYPPGQRLEMEISHHTALPNPIEAEAIIWDVRAL